MEVFWNPFDLEGSSDECMIQPLDEDDGNSDRILSSDGDGMPIV